MFDPMKDLLLRNMDFIFLFYGAAFFFLGTASFVLFMRDRKKPAMPWLWLSLFGFIHGANEWLDMLARSFVDPHFFVNGRIFVLWASFVCLLEFGRRACAFFGKKGLGFWIYAPLFLLFFYFYRIGCLAVAVRYLFGLPGAFLAGLAFWAMRSEPSYRRARFLSTSLAFLFFLYAISTGLVVPRSQFWLSRFLNDAIFTEGVHLPIQVFRATFATLISFLFIYKVTQLTLSMPGVVRGKLYMRVLLVVFIFLYLVFLCAGFWFVSRVEKYERQNENKLILANAKLLEQSIAAFDPGGLKDLRGEAAYQKFRQLHARMLQLADIAYYAKKLYLIFLDDGRLDFVVGSQAQIFPRQVEIDFDANAPPKELFDAAYSKLPTFYGPYQSRAGLSSYSVFVPFLNSDGTVPALLGIDLDGRKIEAQFYKVRLNILVIILAFLILLIVGYTFMMVFLLRSIELEIQKRNLDKALVHIKEAEAELARSEETFRGILNNSPNAIFGFDRDMRIIFWNHGAEKLYGYKKEEVVKEKDPTLNRRFTELFGIEDLGIEAMNIFSGTMFLREVTHKTKAGLVDVIMTLFPVKDPQGRILFGIGLIQDISDHKRFEERLEDAHAQLKTIVDAAAEVAIIACDPTGVVTLFSAGAEKMFRVAGPDAVGKKNLGDFFLGSEMASYQREPEGPGGPAFVSGVSALIQDVRKDHYKMREWILTRSGGSCFPGFLSISGLRNARGEFYGCVAIIFDLTARKETEKSLLASQQRYIDLVNNVNVGVCRMTPGSEGRFLEANPAMVSIFEAGSERELLRHPVSEFYKDGEVRDHVSEKIMQQGSVRNEEVEFVTLKGKPFWASLNAVLKHDEQGGAFFYVMVQDISEHKTAEARLLEERERLESVANSIGAGLSLVNKNFEIVWVNEVLEAWFGKLNTIRGRKCFETYQFKHAICEGCPTRRAFETGQLQSAEQRSVYPDGRVMDFQLICTPVKNRQGEVEHVLELTLDITEKKRMIEMLQYERALSRNVIDSIGEELLVLDCQTKRILDVNKKFLDVTGFSRESVVGKKCDELGFHQYPLCDGCDLQKKILEKGYSESTHIHVDRAGRKYYAEIVLSPLRDSQGGVLGVIHLARDISERKRMEEELRRYSEGLENLVTERTRALQTSELMFRRLFESAQDAILIIDAQSGRIIDANPFFLALSEYTREEIQGVDCRSLLCFGDRKFFDKIFEELKHQVTASREDMSLVTVLEKKELSVELQASMYFVEDKKIVQCNIRDITERKRIEKIKSEFVSMVSHELRTPLSAIKEGVEIVADGTQGKLNKSQEDCLGIALSNIRRLNRLIGDILDISKIQSNLLKVSLAPCDVYQLIDQVYALVRIEMEKRGMVFVTDLEKHLPLVLADKDRLIQVLMNLLNNAAKFTRENSRVTLLARSRGEFVEFGVKDEGAGIPPEELSRLFGKFVQLDSTLVRRVGGTGLGLYISRNLVEAMGGQIWAESKLGEGSVFKFTMPAQRKNI